MYKHKARRFPKKMIMDAGDLNASCAQLLYGKRDDGSLSRPLSRIHFFGILYRRSIHRAGSFATTISQSSGSADSFVELQPPHSIRLTTRTKVEQLGKIKLERQWRCRGGPPLLLLSERESWVRKGSNGPSSKGPSR
jgi:hypothetical protein